MADAKLEDLPVLLRGRPALILGPDICTTATWAQVQRDLWTFILRNQGSVEAENGVVLADYLDGIARDEGTDVRRVHSLAADFFKQLVPNANPGHLAKVRWCSVISLTYDLLFESAIENYFRSSPTPWHITLISNPKTVPRQMQIPIYKLLGSLRADIAGEDLALERSAILIRKTKWPAILATFRDYVRDSATLFLGTENITPQIRDVIGSIIGNRPPYPREFIFS
jgi:hypothetical protein